MDRCGPENAYTLPLPFVIFEEECLDHHTQTLHKENPTEYRNEQFLMDNDSADANDSSDSERTGITHKDLSGVGIIP